MEKGSRVKDIVDRQPAQGVFLARETRFGQGRNGQPYWSLKLADATGVIDAKIWHPLSAAITRIDEGSFVLVGGKGSLYRDQTQFVVESFRELSEAEKNCLDLSEFMRASRRAAADMLAELKELCAREFRHAPWRNLIFSILEDPEIQPLFVAMPAARSIHHAFAGGLLEHTLGVFAICRFLASQYAELDRQTLLAGAILHDLGKIREFGAGPSTEYTEEGRLLGHIFIGLDIIAPHLAASGLEPGLQEHLRHLILSHHGEFEYGAARLPATAEAFALHLADNLDAKMAQCRASLEGIAGTGFGPWENSLARNLFRAARTPEAPREAENGFEAEISAPPGAQVSFEDNWQMNYAGDMPGDDAPVPEDCDIPAEEAIFGAEAALAQAGAEHGQNGRQRQKPRSRDAQCSLLLRA